ncbi:MAG: FHA domain-containing protein [Vulcanimicrobiota bacterium]
MLFKRLFGFFFTAILVLGLGIYLIDTILKNSAVSRGTIDIIILFYIIIVIFVSLFVGRALKLTEDKDNEEEPIIMPKKKGSGKAYAWLKPSGDANQAGFPLIRKLMTIGRDVQSDILVNDISISKKHAQITALPGGFLLRDLDSRNGTFLNNERVEESYLKDGDLITFGEAKFVFSCENINQVIPEAEGDISLDVDIEVEDMDTHISTGSRVGTGTGSRITGNGKRKSRLKDISDIGEQTYIPGQQTGNDKDEEGDSTNPGTGTKPQNPEKG